MQGLQSPDWVMGWVQASWMEQPVLDLCQSGYMTFLCSTLLV